MRTVRGLAILAIGEGPVSARLPGAIEWWLRVLPRLHSRAFRDRHGAEMIEFAADAWSDRAASGSMWAKVAIIVRLSADAMRSGLRSRFARWRRPKGEGMEQTASRDTVNGHSMPSYARSTARS